MVGDLERVYGAVLGGTERAIVGSCVEGNKNSGVVGSESFGALGIEEVEVEEEDWDPLEGVASYSISVR